MTAANSLFLRISVSISVLAIFSINVVAQGVDDWNKYRSANDKLTFSMPQIDVVINVDGRVEVYSYQREAQLAVHKLKSGNAKYYVRRVGSEPDKKTSVRSFTIERFLIKELVLEDADEYRVSFHIGYGGDYYFIEAVAKSRDDAAVSRFLKSVAVAGRSILDPDEAVTVSGSRIEDLHTSKIVNDSLRKVCREDVPIAYDEKGDLKKDLPSPPHYTRDAVLVGLAQPDLAGVPNFIKMSQRKRVELRVILQADGCIGPIIVLEGAKDRESYAALMGAIRSRFLPAQSNGKPVDSAARIYYEFGGY